MGSPPEGASERVDLSKQPAGPDAAPDESFDPYRYGAPDVPPPPEYAPPGYRPPPGYQYPQPGQPTQPGQYPQPGQPQAGNPHGPYPPYPYGTTAPGYGQAPPGYGPAPYGSPYGQPPAGPLGQNNGKAVAALVLGIVSIVLFWTTIFDAIFVILALIFGFLGLGDARRRGGRGRGQALAGLICAVVGAVLAIVFLVFVVHLANKCGGINSQNDSDFQQCVRDQI